MVEENKIEEVVQDQSTVNDSLSEDSSKVENDDPLLNCLEILSELLGHPLSTAAFKTGLPLVNNRLTPELFIRAAERADLSARIIRKSLADIFQFTLPCVLLLEGNKACLFVKHKTDKKIEVIFPEFGRGSKIIPLEKIEKIYTGFAIFASAQYRYDARASDLEVEHPKSWFWGTLWKFWPLYGQASLAAVLINIFAIVSPLFAMNVYDRVVPNNAVETLWALSIGVFIVFGFDFLLKMMRVYYVDMAGKNADIILASRLFEQVLGIKLAARPLSSGGFANQLREFETIRDFFSSVTLTLLIDLPFVFLFVGVIAWISVPLSMVPLFTIPFLLGGALLLQGPLNSWVRHSFKEGAQRHGLLVETIGGLETIKSFGAEGKVQRTWEVFAAQSANSSKSLRLIASLILNFSGFFQQVSYVALIIVGVYLIAQGELSLGGLIAASILSSRIIAPVAQVVGLLTRLNQTRAALDALNKLIELPVERPKGQTFLHRPRLQGKIEFKEVNFLYPHQKNRALTNLNLVIEATSKVGLVGPIGSGKSTIEKLILGLYSPELGSIKIDGIDLRQIDPADLRANIGYIPQDIFLFFGSVRDNIVLGSESASPREILRAAELAGVTEFVRHHPQGFDMPVGEGGGFLSGGQRQSIAVARALIRDPSILIFDEPTAMMDNASEARLIAHLKDIIANKTFILISHRVPVLSLVDRLVVIDKGQIIAHGGRDEVVNAINSGKIRTPGQ